MTNAIVQRTKFVRLYNGQEALKHIICQCGCCMWKASRNKNRDYIYTCIQCKKREVE